MLKDSKFWIAVADGVISLTLYFVAKYTNPSILEDVEFAVTVLQPLVVAIILYLCGAQIARLLGVGRAQLRKG